MQPEDNLPSAPLAREKLTKRQRRLALILAGLPLELGLILFIFNPPYVGAMFRETCGLAMIAAILICVGIAYPLLLGSFTVSSGAEPQGRPTRKAIGYSLTAGILVFCIFPAVGLVVLGPAILVMIASGVFGSVP